MPTETVVEVSSMTVAFAEIKKELSNPKTHKGPGGTGIDYATIKALQDDIGTARAVHRVVPPKTPQIHGFEGKTYSGKSFKVYVDGPEPKVGGKGPHVNFAVGKDVNKAYVVRNGTEQAYQDVAQMMTERTYLESAAAMAKLYMKD